MIKRVFVEPERRSSNFLEEDVELIVLLSKDIYPKRHIH